LIESYQEQVTPIIEGAESIVSDIQAPTEEHFLMNEIDEA